MNESRLSSVGRDNMGRTTIDDARRAKQSKRAAKDKLEVVFRTCQRCNHHKAFVTSTMVKCTRCKHVIWK